MRFASLIVLASSLFSLTSAISQTGPAPAIASPDGVLVPFTSKLPPCASLCGPLFDVQGACAPPVTKSPSQSCFCGKPTLQTFLQGTAATAATCGPASCQDTASLQQIINWYEGFCNKGVPQPTVTSAATSTATSTSTNTSDPSKNQNKSWIAGHYGWVIFAVLVTLGMIGGWVGASFFRRRYLQNKEKEIEMRPPVAWGPHQMQAMTGGFNNNSSEVALSGRIASPFGTEAKVAGGEPAAYFDPARGNRESRGWLRKERR